MSDIRHFLTLLDFSPQELQQLILRSIEMKQAYRAGKDQRAFPGSVLAMFFAKSSTRTRAWLSWGGMPCSYRLRTPNWGAENRLKTAPR